MTREEFYERKYKDSVNDRKQRFLERQQRYAKQEQEKKERELKRELEQKKRNRKNFITGADGKGSIFTIILTILFIILFVRTLLGSTFDVNLGGFLEYISKVPDVSLSWLQSIDLTIISSWGVFDFLRNFINAISSIIEIALMLVGGVAQLLTYIAYLLGYIFM